MREVVTKKKDISISVTATNNDPFFNMLIKKIKLFYQFLVIIINLI